MIGFGAMSGIAYVFDEDGQFARRCNTAMVALGPVTSSAEQEVSLDRALWHKGSTDEALLRALIEGHYKWTGSLCARHILDHWVESRAKFVKVFPAEYKRALGELAAKGLSAPQHPAPPVPDRVATAPRTNKTAVPAK